MKLVIQNTSHVWGGNEKSLAVLAQGMIERGHEVIVSCARGEVSRRLEQMNIATSHFRPRGQIDLVSGVSFALWLKKRKPDALLMTSWGAIPWAAWAAKSAGVRRVVLRQGIVRRAPSAGPHAYALRHWVDALITNAPEIKDVWQQSLPEFPPDQVHVVLNAVTATSSRRDELRTALRAELGSRPDELIVCAAGILSKRKNFEVLFQAFAAARPEGVRIVIVGDGPHRAALTEAVSQLGLSHHVTFLGARENAAKVIGGSDLFVLSSRNEGMANVMLEAMAAGTPVIASDISGVRTAIGKREGRQAAGWIYPADDAAALATMLSTVTGMLRADAAAVRQATNEALWRIENWFTRDRMLQQSEHILFG